MDNYTENLNAVIAQGADTRNKLRDLLDAWDKQGLPNDFYDDNARIAYNYVSKNIFIVNNDSQTAMLNNGKLESFYYLPVDGHEGFLGDLIEAIDGSWHTDDVAMLIRLVNDMGTDEQKTAFFTVKLADEALDFESYYELLAQDSKGNRYIGVDVELLSIVDGVISYGSEAFFDNADVDDITYFEDER